VTGLVCLVAGSSASVLCRPTCNLTRRLLHFEQSRLLTHLDLTDVYSLSGAPKSTWGQGQDVIIISIISPKYDQNSEIYTYFVIHPTRLDDVNKRQCFRFRNETILWDGMVSRNRFWICIFK
jgi:hypothetical protein